MARKRAPKEQEGLFRRGKLFYGDCLDVLRDPECIAPESVDLIYLDPPFNSQRLYNRIFDRDEEDGSPAQIRAFEDSWKWGMASRAALNRLTGEGAAQRGVPERLTVLMEAMHMFLGPSNMLAYLVMMSERIVALHHVLKPTGSLYLHCDPSASHYLKLVLDSVFGTEAFQNEIVWKRTNARTAAGRWPRVHDTLLLYARGRSVVFHPLKVQAEKAKMPHTLITGPDGKKYQTYELTAPNLRYGETGEEWRGFQPARMGRCWANPPRVMEEWDRLGLIHWPKRKGAWPRRRAETPFDPSSRTVTVGDVWTDVDRINQSAKERLKWPTQKPVELLERIVAASSNEGGVVLDPFCGCGTTIEAAHKLGRKWIGIDVAHIAIEIIEDRLAKLGAVAGIDYTVSGEPRDVPTAQRLADDNKWEFQRWAIGAMGAEHAGGTGKLKKGADRGIDGFIRFQDNPNAARSKRVIISVKGGKPTSRDVRDLRAVIERDKAAVGVLFTMQEPTGPMEQEAAEAGFYTREEFPRIQIISVADFFSGKRPRFPGINMSRRSSRPAMDSQPPAPMRKARASRPKKAVRKRAAR